MERDLKMKVPSHLKFFTATLALGGALFAQNSSTPSARVRTKASNTASRQDVESLRDVVQSQQKQIEMQSQQVQQLQDQLHQVLDAVQQANANSQKSQAGLEQAQAAAAQAQQRADDANRAAGEASSAAASATSATGLLEKQTKDQQAQLKNFQTVLGRFRLNGDVRVRGENYAQTGIQDRNRARVRVRLGLDGQLNQDFVGGIAIATGSLGDPTTTNETLTNVFDRKTIGLDRGYITFNPVAHSW